MIKFIKSCLPSRSDIAYMALSMLLFTILFAILAYALFYYALLSTVVPWLPLLGPPVGLLVRTLYLLLKKVCLWLASPISPRKKNLEIIYVDKNGNHYQRISNSGGPSGNDCAFISLDLTRKDVLSKILTDEGKLVNDKKTKKRILKHIAPEIARHIIMFNTKCNEVDKGEFYKNIITVFVNENKELQFNESVEKQLPHCSDHDESIAKKAVKVIETLCQEERLCELYLDYIYRKNGIYRGYVQYDINSTRSFLSLVGKLTGRNITVYRPKKEPRTKGQYRYDELFESTTYVNNKNNMHYHVLFNPGHYEQLKLEPELDNVKQLDKC